MGGKRFRKIAKIIWIVTIFLVAFSMVGYLAIPYISL